MKPDENTQRIKPVEDHDESPNIEREHESEAGSTGAAAYGMGCTIAATHARFGAR